MKLTFVGTGAADWDWQEFPAGTRGATSSLLEGSCLIDFGTETLRNMKRIGIKPSAVRDLVITHSHPDHFRPDLVAELAGSAKRKLRVWASEAALADIPDGLCDKHPVRKGMCFRVAGCTATALPGNHFTRTGDDSFHYLFKRGKATLFYAIDGAWMMAEEKRILANALKGSTIGAIVWDATRGDTPADYRFADHNNLQMIAQLREGMLGCGLIDGNTINVFDHISRGLWPSTPSARTRLAARYKGMLAEDGAAIELCD